MKLLIIRKIIKRMSDHIHFSKRKIENPPIINTIMSMFDHKIRNDHKSIGWL